MGSPRLTISLTFALWAVKRHRLHIWSQGAEGAVVIQQHSSVAFLCFLPQPPFTPSTLSLFFSLSSQLVSLRSSIRPLVLYRKTFLVFYSAPVKPGAYFQCPKLIANVRTDPSSPSTPSQPPPFLALTVRIRGTFSWPYWTLGFYVFEGVLLFI